MNDIQGENTGQVFNRKKNDVVTPLYIEEGLRGRTTIFEDALRNGRNGLDTLPAG